MTSNILEAKDPSDIKDYRIDWTLLLAAEGATGIASSSWSSSTPDGMDLADGSPPTGSPPTGYVDGKVTVLWVSGGTAGILYEFTNTITTTGGGGTRTHQRSIVIPCEQR